MCATIGVFWGRLIIALVFAEVCEAEEDDAGGAVVF